MSNLAKVEKISAELVEQVVIQGDLAQLSSQQRGDYYARVCSSLGLNPLTKPFDYIRLNNKLVLYAKRDATDQLRSIHKISISVTARERIDDVYIVTARAKNADGREDESTGAVSIAGLKGDALANAMMKAETKAKRRVTLSICGLGLLDESEIETIPEVSSSSPREVSPQVAAVSGSEDPGEYKLPTTWRKNGGMKLKDLGADGVSQLVRWLKQLEHEKKLNDSLREVLFYCDAYLRQGTKAKSGGESWPEDAPDSAYDMAGAR